jgi:hypothetical protein
MFPNKSAICFSPNLKSFWIYVTVIYLINSIFVIVCFNETKKKGPKRPLFIVK